ncbi:MAG: hypothetical protein WCY58_02260 [Mariniphaga sp.]|nr:hypothetical protein [Mariniphaga sp.]MDD4227353.1 hypothetical protein [Mariniphaga sp.]MDD4425859.1 hypothetical protein [Mariniphaga sp.]
MIPDQGKFWFTLDNAAKIFPAIITKEVTSVFRLTAVLNQPVRIVPLQKAVLLAEKRFPYYQVRLREGFFWYYLEHFPQHFFIDPDDSVVCRKFSRDGLLIRFLVRDKHLSAEFSHILTDGAGALEFFKTVLIIYAGACGVEIPAKYQFSKSPDGISEEEYEDAYDRYFKAEIPPMVRRSRSYHLPFPLNSVPRYNRLNAILSMKQIKNIAQEKGVSITVYLVSIYFYILQDVSENVNGKVRLNRKKKLRVQVPVNLRNVFPSKTMRNFTLFVMPEIDLRLGHYTFDEILKSVYHQIKLEMDEKLIHKNIARNVGSEKKLYIRGIPLFLKSMILRVKYYSLGTSQYSGVLTNLGNINLPDGTDRLVDYFIMTPPPPNKMLKINCGVAGFGDNLVVSFGNITQRSDFEKKFLQFLSDMNIRIERETNN